MVFRVLYIIYIWIMFALDFPLSDGECIGSARLQIVFFLVKSKVESLLWLATRNRVSLEDCKAATRGILSCVGAVLFLFKILCFLLYIGGCMYLRDFASLALDFTVALNRCLRPRVLDVALIHVDFRAVNFAAMDLWILQRHDLSVDIAVGTGLWLGGSLCCV